jgi:hypothetical protein
MFNYVFICVNADRFNRDVYSVTDEVESSSIKPSC